MIKPIKTYYIDHHVIPFIYLNALCHSRYLVYLLTNDLSLCHGLIIMMINHLLINKLNIGCDIMHLI